jgi:gas vesicle protein
MTDDNTTTPPAPPAPAPAEKPKRAKRVRPPSRAQRWADAISEGKEAAEKALEIVSECRDKIEQLVDQKSEELRDAVQMLMDEMQSAIDMDAIDNSIGALQDVKGEYEEWQGNLPENLASSALGEKLQAVCDVEIPDPQDVDTNCDVSVEWSIEENLEEIVSAFDEAEGLELPQGFGRD